MTSLVPFRAFRGPLFPKPVTGQVLFLQFLTANRLWLTRSIHCIVSFLCKPLLAPQKGSEITKILAHLILANFLVSQRLGPKQDRENRDGLPGCSKAWRLKSWGSEATPSATHSIRIVYDQVSVLIRAENFLSETETFFFKQTHFFSSFPTS